MDDLTDHLEEVQRKICYYFHNIDLLYQAFTRRSYSNQNGGENNEVLEFIGDSVLDFYVIKTMAERFGFTRSDSNYYDNEDDFDDFCIIANKNESDFTTLKSFIVSNKYLASRIDELGFAKYLFMGDCDYDARRNEKMKVKADLFEAIIGAIAIDCEWNPNILQEITEDMLLLDEYLEHVDTKEPRPDKFKLENAVVTLTALAEHGRCTAPEFSMSKKKVRHNGKKYFECTCFVRSWRIFKTVYAHTKIEAERYAAYSVLCEYFDLPNEYEEADENK